MFCRAELVRLQHNLSQIQEHATVVAVSPSSPKDLAKMKERLALEFRLLSDPEARLAKQYGLGYDDPVSGPIPRPTAIVLDREGRIVWSQIAQSLTGRPHPDKLAEVVRAIE